MFKVSLYLPAQAAAETEALITHWNVKSGDSFTKGAVLASAESAKANFDFEAPCDGKVFSVLVAEGSSVTFDTPVIEIETNDQTMKNSVPPTPSSTSSPSVERVDMFSRVADSALHDRLPVYLLGIGSYLPQRIIKTGEMLGEFPGVTEEYMFGVTGIRQRHWMADNEKPSDMALVAAKQAIDKSGITAEAIDTIIVATETPDVTMPSTACILQEKLGIRSVPAFDLHAACSGWLYAISVARGMLSAGYCKNALVVGVDALSRFLDKKDKGTYFLFGDGAGAAVISSELIGHPIRQEILTTDTKGINYARRLAPGYHLFSPGDPAIDPYVRVEGHALFRSATASFAALIRDTIAKSGWKIDDVRLVIPHQANGRILKAAAEKAGVPFDRFYLNIDRVGNTSSASIPIAFAEIEKGLQKKDKIILCSVGAGITAAAISIEW